MFRRAMATIQQQGPVALKIKQKLETNLAPVLSLDIINESYKHAGGAGKESHFNVVVVSDKFEGLSVLERHRLVNTILADELKSDVHALSIKAKTGEQWRVANQQVTNTTPNCAGAHK